MSSYINKRPYIIINGIDSRTWSDIIVTELPPISKPKIRTQVEEVDGRDGDIITPLGYAAYDKTVKIGLKGGSLGISPSQINYYIGIFNSSGTIIFSDEPTKYYRYAIYEQIDFERLIRYRTAEITFHVQPFKFSTTEAPIVRNGSGSISVNVNNSGNIYARPELLLTGSGNATVDLNSSEILSVDLDSANGAIFIDSENMNAYGANSAINNVIAYINPVQDLHGYGSAWIGGAGKNKAQVTATSQTIDDITYTVNTDGTIKANGTATSASILDCGQITLNAGNSYILSGCPTGGSGLTYCLFLRGSGSFAQKIDFGTGISFTVDETVTTTLSIIVYNGTTTNNLEFKPMIRLSGTSSDFEPYENICPISGFTELNIIDNGVNQWDEVCELGIYNMTTGLPQPSNFSIRGKNRIIVKPNTTYYANNNLIRRLYYDFNDNFISSKGGGGADTTPSNCCFMRIYLADTYGTTYNNDISINYPATDTSYHAYSGNTYNIDISENPQDPDNPQIVYGGYYESNTGLLNITYGKTTINNCISNRTTSYANPVFYGSINGLKPQTNNILSECFNVIDGKPSASSFAVNSNNGDFAINSANTGADIQVFLRYDEYTDVTSLKNAVGNTAIVFELAEPIQIQLAPTQINNLIGLNQVFTDTNGDVAVDYRASGEAHFEQDPIVSFTCTFEDIIKGTLLNRAVTGNYDNIKLNIGLNNLVVNESGVNQFAIDKYSRWL